MRVCTVTKIRSFYAMRFVVEKEDKVSKKARKSISKKTKKSFEKPSEMAPGKTRVIKEGATWFELG